MNALEATQKLRQLQSQAGALARVTYYLNDNTDFFDDVDVLSDLQREIEGKRDELADKLRTVDV